MILGIDASNLRGGGGITHLVELLAAAEPSAHGISSVVVWSGHATLERIADRPWLTKRHEPWLDRGLPYRVFWQRFLLSKRARESGCELLFVPGGSYAGNFRPIVTMCRNMLPFEWRELRRYGISALTLKWLLLRWSQSRSFRHADGLIFLTQYARKAVMPTLGGVDGRVTTVPHGIHPRFVLPPRPQRTIDTYSTDRPYRILYVSVIDWYKHQWHVAEAVARLRKSGLPVALDLVGPGYPPALARLKGMLARVDSDGSFIRYCGPVPHAELHARYGSADMCLFASSCENMPNILLEGMASGLPIVCSGRGPMPEVLGDAGAYFDPENPDEIATAIRQLIESPQLRAQKAAASSGRVRQYSWQRCADETLGFLASVARTLA